MHDIHTNLKYFRVKYGHSQKEVAKNIGVTAQAYCRYESGKRSIDIELLHIIAKYYNLPIILFIYPIQDIIEMSKSNQNESSKLYCSFEFMYYDTLNTINEYWYMHKKNYENVSSTKTNSLPEINNLLNLGQTGLNNLRIRFSTFSRIMKYRLDKITEKLEKN